MLGANTRVVKTRTNGVHRCDLAILVLAEVALHPVEDAERARGHGRGGLRGVHAPPGGLAADELDSLVSYEVVEAAYGV